MAIMAIPASPMAIGGYFRHWRTQHFRCWFCFGSRLAVFCAFLCPCIAHAMSGRVRRLSGLQKQVLSLYRECLRAANAQPTPEAQTAAKQYVSSEFRKQVSHALVATTHGSAYLIRA